MKRAILERLLGVRPSADWESQYTEAGFDTWETVSYGDQEETYGVFDSSSGVSIRFTDFPESFGAQRLPPPWSHVPGESSTLVELDHAGVTSVLLMWIPEHPDRLWDAVVEALTNDRWCEHPREHPPVVVHQAEWLSVTGARTFWRHPSHDVYRYLTRYLATVETQPVDVIALTAPQAHPNGHGGESNTPAV
jgi:hypothetical protein